MAGALIFLIVAGLYLAVSFTLSSSSGTVTNTNN